MVLPSDWSDIFAQAGSQYGVDPAMLRAQAMVESGGNPNAVSSTGAVGPMQFMPATAKALGITDPTDPTQSIFGAAQLMRQNYDRYGDWDTALQAYHAGPNQSGWGPLTRAYPNKVKAAMDTSFTQTPLGDPNFQLFPDQGDGRGGFYFNAVTGQMVPAQVGPRPGDNSLATADSGGSAPNQTPNQSQTPDQPQTPDPTQLDLSGLPGFGANRFSSGFSLGGPQDQQSILQDPNYKDAAILKMAGGMASGMPALAGLGAGLTAVGDTALTRTQNNVAMQRLEAMYGTRGMQVASSLIRTGMQPSAAYRAAGITLPPDLAAQMDANSQTGKAVPAGVQKLTNDGFEGIRSIRTANATLDQLQQKLKSGEFSLNPLKVKFYQAQAALGNPMNSQAVIDYQQLSAAVANLTGVKLKEQSGVQTDKDADMARDALVGGGLTSNDQAVAHFNYIKNLGHLEELGIRNNLTQAYKNSKQPAPNFDELEKSLPGAAPQYDAKTIGADMYADHMHAPQSSQQPAGNGVGQGAMTVGETRQILGVPVKKLR